MTSKLFESFEIDGLRLKNRIMMSPMCMYSANGDGLVTDWHVIHYVTRAVGQVGLIMLEVSAVEKRGFGDPKELGIWDEEHISGLKKIVDLTHAEGAKIGIQIGHAGRKSELGNSIAPSEIAFDDKFTVPKEMDQNEIDYIIQKFKEAAIRADKAGFDVVEIHAAHGYLINQFLSPLANKRMDNYGGVKDNRYQFLKEIIDAIREVWNKPLFVRISANEFHDEGNSLEDIQYFAGEMKKQGVALITASAGGVVPAVIDAYPGYEVPYADFIKHKVDIPTGAVGLITDAFHAEEILKNNRADLIVIGRELLRDPYWVYRAAKQLEEEWNSPQQYKRGWDYKRKRVKR